jgi:hypothetical protein
MGAIHLHQHTFSDKTARSTGAAETPWWIVVSAVAAVTALGTLSGCAVESGSNGGVAPGLEPAAEGTHATVYGGSTDMADDGVVALKITKANGDAELCSGALIANNVVLTARHCVTPTITSKVVCNEKGISENGHHFGDDSDPASIQVFRGQKSSLTGMPAAHGKAIVHDDSQIVCDHDIAILVLDHAIPGATPYKVRTEGGVAAGENVKLVGYGQNDQSSPLGTRLERNLSILAVGSAVSASKTALATHEFELGAGSCEGDSGGPAFSADTGAIVGVVSRGGSCTDDFGHVFTQTNDTADILTRAFAIAGGAPMTETSDPDAPATTSSTDRAAQSSSCAMANVGGDGKAGSFGALLFAAALVLAARSRRRG